MFQYIVDEIVELRYAGEVRCAHCDSFNYVKNGRRKDGIQRYLCRDCRKSFLATTNSLLEGTHNRLSIWVRYLECMMEKKTLRETSEVCGISVATAFTWRHKILDALRRTVGCIRLGGTVEADETYIPVSYKGNHSRSHSFSMPRNPHKRGHDTHTYGLSFEQVCVPCAVDRAGVPVSGIGKLGKVSSSCIGTFFRERFHPDTVLCTDQEKAYRSFAKERGLPLIQMDTYCYQAKNLHNTVNYRISQCSRISRKLAAQKEPDRIRIRLLYERKEAQMVPHTGVMGIDTGVNNLLTVCMNTGACPFLISGRPVKSVNRYYNKRKGELQSAAKKGNRREHTKRMDRLTARRNRKIMDHMHKASRAVVEAASRKYLWETEQTRTS